MNLEIKDKFLDTEYFDELKMKFTENHFPYYLSHTVSGNEGDFNIQFEHCMYRQNQPTSDWYYDLEPLLKKLRVCSLIRAKVNLLQRTDHMVIHGFHTDIPDAPTGYKTAILYLNNNNGLTVFRHDNEYNEVKNIENRIAIFDGEIQHSGTTNTCEEPYRLVLNLDYFENAQ